MRSDHAGVSYTTMTRIDVKNNNNKNNNSLEWKRGNKERRGVVVMRSTSAGVFIHFDHCVDGVKKSCFHNQITRINKN